ncbi:MAG: hypothetical protein ABI548_21180 [Polyangiaceae bacterium]
MRCPPFRFGVGFSLGPLAWCAVLAAACSLSGCGGSHDDISKRLAAMQSDLTKLQGHSDRLEERLEVLEVRKDAAPAKPASDAAATLQRPRLMIVKLEPGDDTREAPADAPTAELRPEDSAADKSPRPVIRVYGSHSDGDIDGSASPRHKR